MSFLSTEHSHGAPPFPITYEDFSTQVGALRRHRPRPYFPCRGTAGFQARPAQQHAGTTGVVVILLACQFFIACFDLFDDKVGQGASLGDTVLTCGAIVNTAIHPANGGFLGSMIAGTGLNGFSLWSIVLAVVGSIVLLWIYRLATRRRTTVP